MNLAKREEREARYTKYKNTGSFYHNYANAFVPEEYKRISSKFGKSISPIFDLHNIITDTN